MSLLASFFSKQEVLKANLKESQGLEFHSHFSSLRSEQGRLRTFKLNLWVKCFKSGALWKLWEHFLPIGFKKNHRFEEIEFNYDRVDKIMGILSGTKIIINCFNLKTSPILK